MDGANRRSTFDMHANCNCIRGTFDYLLHWKEPIQPQCFHLFVEGMKLKIQLLHDQNFQALLYCLWYLQEIQEKKLLTCENRMACFSPVRRTIYVIMRVIKERKRCLPLNFEQHRYSAHKQNSFEPLNKDEHLQQ